MNLRHSLPSLGTSSMSTQEDIPDGVSTSGHVRSLTGPSQARPKTPHPTPLSPLSPHSLSPSLPLSLSLSLNTYLPLSSPLLPSLSVSVSSLTSLSSLRPLVPCFPPSIPQHRACNMSKGELWSLLPYHRQPAGNNGAYKAEMARSCHPCDTTCRGICRWAHCVNLRCVVYLRCVLVLCTYDHLLE
jgi:hypothetical protein